MAKHQSSPCCRGCICKLTVYSATQVQLLNVFMDKCVVAGGTHLQTLPQHAIRDISCPRYVALWPLSNIAIELCWGRYHAWKFDRDWTMYLWEESLPWRPWQRLSTAHVYFYWSKFQFTSKHGSSESTSGLFANTKRLLHLFAGWLFVKVKAVENRLGDYLSHSSVQCSLLGPSFLLRSFNTTYSLKSGHKCFCTIQPGLQNLSPSSQWWEQEMIGWCPHILYPNGHQF